MDVSFVPFNRPKWRTNKRKDTAVKVYTVAKESRYFLLFNVPCFASESDLINVIGRFGEIVFCKKVSEQYDHPEFTEVYNAKFISINSAREMKRKCDELSLLGSILHIQYAPEFESFEETKQKFVERREKVIELASKYQRRKEKALKKPIIIPPEVTSTPQSAPKQQALKNIQSSITKRNSTSSIQKDSTETLVLSIREKLKRVSKTINNLVQFIKT